MQDEQPRASRQDRRRRQGSARSGAEQPVDAVTSLAEDAQSIVALSGDALRAEVNFLVLPFFALYDNEVWTRSEMMYRAVTERRGQKVDMVWSVAAHPKYGYPGPFDRKLHRAIEHLVSRLEPPIQNPIRLGSLHSLAGLLGLRPSGQTYQAIKESLRRLQFTAIETRAAFYHKEREEWLEDSFHLYERVVFRGHKLPGGEMADTNYLYLGSWYLDNLNAWYVKPLDYTYYRSLRSHAAARLYELLGVKFYGMRSSALRYRYSTLCQLLPLTRQPYLSKAREKLQPAHNELVRTGFLADVAWEEIAAERGDWYISYRPGSRAKEDRSRGRRQQPSASSSQALSWSSSEAPVPSAGTGSKPRSSQQDGQAAALSAAQQDLADRLVALGVTGKSARALVQQRDAEAIQGWLEVVEESDEIADRPAYLVKALREQWALPEHAVRRRAEREEAERTEAEHRLLEACPWCGGRGVYRVDAWTVARCEHGTSEAPPGGRGWTESPELAEVWRRALAEVKQQIPRPAYETWLGDARLLGLEGETAVVEARDAYAAEHLERHLVGVLTQALAHVFGWDVGVRFVGLPA